MRNRLTVLACGMTLASLAQAPDQTADARVSFEKFGDGTQTPTEVSAVRVSAHGLSAKLLFVDYPVGTGEDKSMSNGIDLAYRYRLNDRISLVAPLKLGLLQVPEQSGVRQPFIGVDVTAQAGHDLLDGRVRGYATGGLGFVGEPMRGANVQMPIGVGAAVRIGEAASLTAQYEFRVSSKASRHNTQFGVGGIFDFGRRRYNPKYWDTDGDGVTDDIDACYNVVGLVQHNGCPDSDGDGVHDAADPCPTAAAAPGEGGCPDRDRDGVPDGDDACPNLPGDLVHFGCPPPDLDHDGFIDEIDDCPGVPGKLMGCPDTDADGIADATDSCPKQAGPKETDGCPDRDGDSFPDHADNCPLQPGSLNGCPDRDKDGVDDGTDRCPNTPGEAAYDGCPEIESAERSIFEYAVRPLAFESGSAVIDARGYADLTILAEIMNRYAEYRVRLSGHVDEEEPVQELRRLSKQRANACASFLSAQGVAADRILAQGFGDERPIVEQGSDEERSANRRVEIELWVE